MGCDALSEPLLMIQLSASRRDLDRTHGREVTEWNREWGRGRGWRRSREGPEVGGGGPGVT